MNTSTIALVVGVIVVAAAAFWYWSSMAPSKGPLVAEVSYACAEGKTIEAAYYEGGSEVEVTPGEPPVPAGSVEIVLSDGRRMTLPQTLSASGIRYANAGESFIFWSRGDTAFVDEGGEVTYADCMEEGTLPQGDGTGVSENLILGINVHEELGEYLTAFNGMTVYTFANDAEGVSNCTGQCAANWPPYAVGADDRINVPSIITGDVDTIIRADGSLQVTYNGLPLYFWQGDAQPGDTTGEGVNGMWTVARP